MINERQAVERLVAVCPEFGPHWQGYLDSWDGTPSGEYNDVGALADWVVDRIVVGDLACFGKLFEEVEGLLANATTDVRNLIVIGLLEDIQYISKDRGIDPDITLGFLGRESRKEWFFLVRSVQRDWPGQRREEG